MVLVSKENTFTVFVIPEKPEVFLFSSHKGSNSPFEKRLLTEEKNRLFQEKFSQVIH